MNGAAVNIVIGTGTVETDLFLGTGREAALLAYAFMTGVVLGSVSDVLRALPLSVRHCRAAVAVEDAVFTLFFGAVYYIFCVELLEGMPRLFVLVGMAAGFVLYLISLGRIICGILSTVFGMLKKLFHPLLTLLKKLTKYLCGLTVFKRVEKNYKKTLAQTKDNDV